MIRQKLLAALGDIVGDVSEDLLIDILLESYHRRQEIINRLEKENVAERIVLQNQRADLEKEYHRMKRDPLYCAHGEYFFDCNSRKFCIKIQGRTINFFERSNGVNFAGMQISAQDFVA